VNDTVVKVIGTDMEFGNFVIGEDSPYNTCAEASRAIHRAAPGIAPAGRYGSARPDRCGCGDRGSGFGAGAGWDSQDHDRKWLAANGACFYIDSNHLEGCTPEVRSAYDFVAAKHAVLRAAQEALARANAAMPAGRRIVALVNNSDGRGHSYGSHINVLITRRCYGNIFGRLNYMGFLATFNASAVVFGAGKVGSENDRPPAAYQLSQRADFAEALIGFQTMFNRPLINSRDESLCGERRGDGLRLARLHIICMDNTICHVGTLLVAGCSQLVLAMLEQGCVDANIMLEDPLGAVLAWSHDPALQTRAPAVSGLEYTAAEMQAALLERAKRFVEAGRAEGIVLRAADIIAVWESVVGQLLARDYGALALRLDWAAKLGMIHRAMARRPDLEWASPELKALDHRYSSLDPAEGLYFQFDRQGLLERVASDAEIERFVHEPPADTRAWLRANLLRRADPDTVADVDWDEVVFRFRRESGGGGWREYDYIKVDMSDPRGSTRLECGAAVGRTKSLRETLLALGGEAETYGASAEAPQANVDAAGGDSGTSKEVYDENVGPEIR
jgi:proteasome accessory factor A